MFLSLILLAALMAAASFAAGTLPWRLGVQLHQINAVSALSMGILLGTVLSLVIPEGVETVFDAPSDYLIIPKSSAIGLSLVSGFMIMLLVDQFTTRSDDSKPSSFPDDAPITVKFSSVLKSTLSLGLLLHSSVDGIALGTSFFHQSNAFHIFLFIMIVIHKLPTALSLAVVLRQEGFSSAVAEFHLLLFSLSAPVASILTYIIVKIFNLDSPLVLGFLLLLSAGTFLFSVLHVMMQFMNGENDIDSHASLDSNQLTLCIVGMFIPVGFLVAGAH